MKRTIFDVGNNKKLTVEVTPAITRAAKKSIRDLAQFGARFKTRCTMKLSTVEELAAIHGTGVIRALEKGMKYSTLTDAAMGGCKKAYMLLARSKTGRLGIKQLKIKEPKIGA